MRRGLEAVHWGTIGVMSEFTRRAFGIRFRRGERWHYRKSPISGQSLIELAIAVPIMLLIMLGTIDVGRLFFGYIEMTNAVREGAEYAAHRPSETDKIRSYVTRHAEDLPVANITVTCSNGNCGTAVAGNRVTVSATWQFTPLTGQFLGAFFGLPRFDLQVTSTMRVL